MPRTFFSRAIATEEAGLTLIEVLVVLSIIGILSCLAYPSYSSYWRSLKRLDGRIALLEARTCLEQYALSSGRGYKGSTLAAIGVNKHTSKGWYHLSLVQQAHTNYLLIAYPNFSDAACTELSCDAAGNRFYKGEGSYHECWGA